MRQSMEDCACRCGRFRCASVELPRHGTAYRYRILGCGCEECLREASNRTNARKKRKNAESRDGAWRAGRTWTGPELETVLRTDLTVAEIATMLGRTRQAVSVMRSLCHTDPKYITRVGALHHDSLAAPAAGSGETERAQA